jgi:hypothetical protein
VASEVEFLVPVADPQQVLNEHVSLLRRDGEPESPGEFLEVEGRI